MTDNKKRLVIVTAKNLRTTSDCSPETILNILDNLDPESCTVDVVLIDSFVPKEMRVEESQLIDLPMYIPFDQVFKHKLISKVINLEELTFGEMSRNYDMAIVAIYNDLGEDGKFLGILDILGIPYLSPSLKVSAVCFDKSYTRSILSANNVVIPKGFFVHTNEYSIQKLDQKIVQEVGYPVVVKAVSSGNSYGMSIVKVNNELEKAMKMAYSFSEEVLIEQLIVGQEYTVGVIGQYLNPTTLPAVQISSHSEFFDYSAKYEAGKSEEICPAPVSSEVANMLSSAARFAYIAVKGDSHARIDMILSSQDNKVYVLDINTFPGLNSASLFPKELIASGTSLKNFLNEEIKLRAKLAR